MSYNVNVVNVHWGYDNDPNSMFDNFVTIHISYYGDSPKESSIKKELKKMGLATKPIKHLKFFAIS